MPRVLIAADESDVSLEAAAVAHRLFGDDAEYWMINVGAAVGGPELLWGYPYTVTMPITTFPPVISAHEQELAVEHSQHRAAQIAEQTGLPAAPLGDTGDPAVAIIEAAQMHNADVIVVGSHQRSWFARLFGGSVSSAVVRQAEIPVLVVK